MQRYNKVYQVCQVHQVKSLKEGYAWSVLKIGHSKSGFKTRNRAKIGSEKNYLLFFFNNECRIEIIVYLQACWIVGDSGEESENLCDVTHLFTMFY